MNLEGLAELAKSLLTKKPYLAIRDFIVSFLKEWALDWLLKKVLGTAIGGIKGWILTKVYEHLWSKKVVPLVYWVFRKIKRPLDKWQNNKAAKKVSDAKSEADFDNAFDELP